MSTLVKGIDVGNVMWYPTCMDKEVMYTLINAARFLGVSRQQAYNRMEKEGWPGCEHKQIEDGFDDDGNQLFKDGTLLVPSSVVKKSRDLERRKLIQRVDKLDALTTKQNMNDAMEVAKREHGL